jgi:sigma-B regulation protein RsbU (phosphoserine phosphatase)
VFAGAHEDIIVVRAATGKSEILQTPGTWVGALADVDRFTVETVCQMSPGDVMVLYTDGVTESMNDNSEQFGIDRLVEIAEKTYKSGVDAMRDAVMNEIKKFSKVQADDITLLLLRFVG